MDTPSLTTPRLNAIAGWVLVGVLVLVAAGRVWSGALLDGALSLLLAGVAAAPPVRTRDWQSMVPWPLLFGATVAVVARGVGVVPETAGFLALSMLALVVVVELELFTPVELGRRVATSFAVMTTMAIGALWIIAQFYSDLWLGTGFMTTQTELQRDIVLLAVAGFVTGGIYYAYATQVEPAEAALGRNRSRG